MYQSILVLACFLAVAFTQPSYGNCENRFRNVTINFDDIESPDNSAPPSRGYSGLNWHGWSVMQAPNSTDGLGGNYSIPFEGASPANVLRGGPPGSQFIATSVQGTVDNFRLKSFDLACFNFISHGFIGPTRCSFQITVGDVYGTSTLTTQTFRYKYKAHNKKHPKLVSYNGPVAKGQIIFFEVLGQPAGDYPIKPGTSLIVDNIVVEEACGMQRLGLK